jgi:hypothetical protein
MPAPIGFLRKEELRQRNAEMTFATSHDISAHDLVAMASGMMEDTISDLDFLETLAGWRMFIVTPWVMEALPEGRLRKVTRLKFTVDGEVDKAKVLLTVAREVRRTRERIGGRFGEQIR